MLTLIITFSLLTNISFNNDILLSVKRGGLVETDIIDTQGNLTDLYNTQKKSDADASGPTYEHISAGNDTLSVSNLEAKVLEILDNHNINH